VGEVHEPQRVFLKVTLRPELSGMHIPRPGHFFILLDFLYPTLPTLL
jgi:hypothetical protein